MASPPETNGSLLPGADPDQEAIQAELRDRGFSGVHSARKIKPLSTIEVRATIQRELDRAVFGFDSHLQESRRKAMKYYLGAPLGNEQPDRSSVVMTDVADTIEWIMPQLMRVYAGGTQIARFTPVPRGQPSPAEFYEMEQQAEQASDFLNNRFYHHMGGYHLLYEAFKTGLLEKNAVWKITTVTETEPKEESYEGLSEEQVMILLQEGGPQIEVRAHEVQQGPDGQPLIDIDIVRLQERKKLEVVGVPPEQFFHEPRLRVLDDRTGFCGDRHKVTISDLIAMGVPPEVATQVPSSDTHEWDINRTTRFQPEEDEVSGRENLSRLDEASREVWLSDVYMRIDQDGDGHAELRRFLVAGDSNVVIIENEPANHIPYAGITPVPMPYKWNGRSIADQVMDLQLIRSTLMRQMLDNLYLTNNPRTVVNEDKVTLDDLLIASPGGIIRTEDVEAVKELNVGRFPPEAFGMLEYLDRVRQNRTGIDAGPGQEAASQHDTLGGVSRIMEVAQSRIDSIARTFAETGVKRLFWLMYRNMVENGFQPEITRLRGEYTQVDPSTWSEDMDLTIQTGLGVGAAQGRIQNLQIVMQTQAQLAQFGLQSILLKPQNVWNVVAEMTRAIGYENPEMFFTNPGLEQDFPPPPPDPDLIKAEATAMGTQADSQIKKEEADTKLGQQMSLDKFRNSELASTVQIAALKAASDIQVANIRARGQVESAEQRAEAREEASDGDSGGNPSSSE